MKDNKDFFVFYSKQRIILTTITIFIFGWLCGCIKPVTDTLTENVEITINSDTIYVSDVDEFTPEKLVTMLEDLNIKYPHIVLAQSMIETGHWSSALYRENNNLFGMKRARRRITSAIGTKNGHAYYNNWRDSVYDYAFYQARYVSHTKNEEEYLSYLGRSYAEADHYVNTIRKVISREELKIMFG